MRPAFSCSSKGANTGEHGHVPSEIGEHGDVPPATEVMHGHVHPGRALIVEDVRVAEATQTWVRV